MPTGTCRLIVFAPDRYDLAMMKLARGASHDIDALEGLHGATPFDLDTLLVRFRETDTLGDGLDFKYAFLGLIERLFGALAADRIDADLSGR